MKPILFNTEMVRALLAGRKTVTRRVIKPKPPCELRKMPEGYHAGEWHLYSENPLIDKVNHSPWGAQFIPPFQPGDILWVRETWARLKRSDGSERFVYRASDTYPFGESGYIVKFRWHPSIHMPKEAARIFLRVTGVRVEQLQEIDDAGVVAEGLKIGDPFDELWDSTLKPADLDNYGWEANPWVWVISFQREGPPAGWSCIDPSPTEKKPGA